MKNFTRIILFILLIVGCNVYAQPNIRVRGVGIDIWNVSATSSDRQLIFPKGIKIDWETRDQFSTPGEQHLWRTRPSNIAGKDYATTPIKTEDGRVCSMQSFSVDVATTVVIAIPINNLNAPGWTRRSSGDFNSSINTFYQYTYNYTTPNTWVNIPYYNRDRPTLVFGEKFKIKFDNPLPIADQSEGVLIEDKELFYNRQGSGIFYSYDPNLVILSNGDYIAARNGRRFISKDKGLTWTVLAAGYNVEHASTFEHNGALYIIGDEQGLGNHETVITKSTNGGQTWSTPVKLGFNGRNSPSPVMVSKGRIWLAMEDEPTAIVILVSAPENSDLMNKSNWKVTSRPDSPQSDPGDDSEPCMTIGRDGWPIAFSILEGPVKASSATSATEMFPSNQFNLPSRGSKFAVQYDAVTDKYWALTSYSPIAENQRTGITLFSSSDLKTWKQERVVIQGTSTSFHGFNYPFPQFDGNDIVFASRTAWENSWGQAQRWHDTNMLTFHRVRNFRGTSPTTCSIVPYIQINNDSWKSVSTATVDIGAKIWFGPQSQEFGATAGTWSYTGPSSQTHSGRSWEIVNIQANQAGTYTVKDVDQNGCTATHVFQITVNGGNAAPTISFTQPTNGATFTTGDDIYAVVNASDSDGSIANVQLFINNVFVRQEGIAPYEWGAVGQNDALLQNMAAGAYTLRAVATDNAGSSSEKTITVTVNGAPTGTFFLKNVSTGKVLDANADGVIVLGNQGTADDQKWNFITTTDGYVMLDNGMADRGPITAKPAPGNLLTWLAESYNDNPYANREWLPIRVSGNIYKFQCRDAARGYIASSATGPINQVDGNATTAHWELVGASGQSGARMASSMVDATEEQADANVIKVYPNPASASGFTIDFNGKTIAEVSIFGLDSRRVYHQVLDGRTSSLKVESSLKAGMYIIKLADTSGKVYAKKIAIN